MTVLASIRTASFHVVLCRTSLSQVDQPERTTHDFRQMLI